MGRQRGGRRGRWWCGCIVSRSPRRVAAARRAGLGTGFGTGLLLPLLPALALAFTRIAAAG